MGSQPRHRVGNLQDLRIGFPIDRLDALHLRSALCNRAGLARRGHARITALDGATARRQARRAEDRGYHLDDECAAVAKKNEQQPHLSKYWKIPPDGDAAFVAVMEEVLAVYRLPHDPQFPVDCMEESSKQLVGEVHAPIPAAAGHGRIIDHEYVRHGVATLFVEVEPLAGRRHVAVTERRTRQDWAGFVKTMLD